MPLGHNLLYTQLVPSFHIYWVYEILFIFFNKLFACWCAFLISYVSSSTLSVMLDAGMNIHLYVFVFYLLFLLSLSIAYVKLYFSSSFCLFLYICFKSFFYQSSQEPVKSFCSQFIFHSQFFSHDSFLCRSYSSSSLLFFQSIA